jgi:hypothetical protein
MQWKSCSIVVPFGLLCLSSDMLIIRLYFVWSTIILISRDLSTE